MKKLSGFILSVVFVLSPAEGSASANSQELGSAPSNAVNVAPFKKSMKKTLDEQEAKVKALKDVVFDLKAPVDADSGDKLVNDTVMLEVKRNLYKNFIDNPVNQDPQFQALLLKIMNQSVITEDDLKALQKAADDARSRQPMLPT